MRGVPSGIRHEQLDAAQRDGLERLVRHYLDRARPEVADAEWARIASAGLSPVTFAWAGPDVPGRGHYYAIRGPAFLIEYDNTQNGANHIHCGLARSGQRLGRGPAGRPLPGCARRRHGDPTMRRLVGGLAIAFLVLGCGSTNGSKAPGASASSGPTPTATANISFVQERAAGITIKDGDKGSANLTGGKYRIGWYAPGCTMLGIQWAAANGDTIGIDVHLPSGEIVADLPRWRRHPEPRRRLRLHGPVRGVQVGA